jgi:DNA (cytosine-5)-methyltransferase 1
VRHLDLFSGIGGFALAAQQVGGISTAQFVEIDPYCRAVLAARFPSIPQHEDVTTYEPSDAVDIVTAGFPCQDVSIAGARAGLAGARSGLFSEILRIIDRQPPRWLLLENVTGLLSSNGGQDMATVVGALGERGYGWAYRTLDCQYWGVPQQRRRVFIVGHSGGRSDRAAQVLFEPACLPRRAAPNQAARRDDLGRLGSQSSGSGWRDDTERMTFVASALTGHASGSSLRGDGSDNLTPHSSLDDGAVIPTVAGVRRLTPRECERLQGFPDDWTLIPYSSRWRAGRRLTEEPLAPDSHRYRALGNSVPVPVVTWILRRLVEVDSRPRLVATDQTDTLRA